MSTGWVSLHRKITEHWLWDNPRELKWWLTILLSVNHDSAKVFLYDGLYEVHAGESFRSIENWAALFGCSKKTALKFLKTIEKDGMIQRKILGKGNRRKHLLSVVNWDKYQKPETGNSPERKPKSTP